MMFHPRREATWSIGLIIGLTLTVSTLLLAMPSAGAQESQTWNFTSQDHAVLDSPNCDEDSGFCLMEKDTSGVTEDVTLEEEQVMTWVASEPVEIDSVDFQQAEWTLTLDCEEGITITGQGTVNLGAIDSEGTFVGAGESAYDCTEDEVSITPNDDFEISNGEYLAIQFELDAFSVTGTYTHTFITENMGLSSPSTDPGYPVWEVSSAGLLGVGLLGIALIARRR